MARSPTLACANCGALLVGRFCHECGQAARAPASSVRAFLRELAADLTQLDSRALRSVLYLFTRPGFLTREYLAGRRVRYSQPLQLYLVAAAAFFLVNAYRPFVTFDPQTGRITSSLSSAAAGLELGPSEIDERAPGIPIEIFGERFQATVTGYLPTLLVGSVLLFALLLLLFYRRDGRGYLEHLIFALHWTAFYLLLMIFDRLVGEQQLGRLPVQAIIGLAALGYLVLALRTAYPRPWPGTLLRGVGLFAGFQALLVLWMFSAIALAFAFL